MSAGGNLIPRHVFLLPTPLIGRTDDRNGLLGVERKRAELYTALPRVTSAAALAVLTV